MLNDAEDANGQRMLRWHHAAAARVRSLWSHQDVGLFFFGSIYCCNLSRRCLGNLCTLFQVDRKINPAVTNGLFQAACYFIITFCTSVMDKPRAPKLFAWADSMPKQTRAGLKKWKTQQHNSAADPGSASSHWGETGKRCRTNKNTPEKSSAK